MSLLRAKGPGRGKLRAIRRDGKVLYQADYVDFTGKRHRRVLSDNRVVAERILTTLLRRRDLEKAGMSSELGLDMSIEEVAEHYLKDLARRAKPHSVWSYRRAVTRIRTDLGITTVRDITKLAILRWRDSRIEEGASHKTVNTEVGALKAALAFAVQIGLLGMHPLDGLKSLPVTAGHRKRPPRALTDDELARLLAAAAEFDRQCEAAFPREPLVRALAGSGARWGELTRTTWADFDEDRRSIRLREETTKTKVGRTLPLAPEVMEAILEQRKAFVRIRGVLPDSGTRIFLSPDGHPWGEHTGNFRKHLVLLFEKAGISRRDSTGRVVHIHALRHTFATRLAREGVPIQIAQVLTGHRSVQMLAGVYSHLGTEDARNAIECLPRPGSRGSIANARGEEPVRLPAPPPSGD